MDFFESWVPSDLTVVPLSMGQLHIHTAQKVGVRITDASHPHTPGAVDHLPPAFLPSLWTRCM
jgi:hypothetical protein